MTPTERASVILGQLVFEFGDLLPKPAALWLEARVAASIREAVSEERHRCAELAKSAIHACTPCMHEGFPTIPIPPPAGPPGVTKMD